MLLSVLLQITGAGVCGLGIGCEVVESVRPLPLTSGNAPWIGDAPASETRWITTSRAFTDGGSQYLHWVALDGTVRSSNQVMPRIRRFLERESIVRPAFNRSDLHPRFTGRDESISPELAAVTALDYGWALVSVDPIVLIGFAEPIEGGGEGPWRSEDSTIIVTPWGDAQRRQDGVLLRHGVFAAARFPAGQELFWCSPTHGIGLQHGSIDAEGDWHISLPGRRIRLSRHDGMWQLVESVATQTRRPALDPVLPVASPSRHISGVGAASLHDGVTGEWSGVLGTLWLRVRLDPGGTGTVEYGYAMIPTTFTREIRSWTIDSGGRVAMQLRQVAGTREIRPMEWTAQYTQEMLDLSIAGADPYVPVRVRLSRPSWIGPTEPETAEP